MFSFGFGEILVVGVILLLFVGPDRLPQLMRTVGRGYGQLRRSADELRRAFMMEADRIDSALRVEDLEKRRAEIAEHRKKAMEAAGHGAAAQVNQIEYPEPADNTGDSAVPAGFTDQEWDELPDHLKQSVLSAVKKGVADE